MNQKQNIIGTLFLDLEKHSLSIFELEQESIDYESEKTSFLGGY